MIIRSGRAAALAALVITAIIVAACSSSSTPTARPTPPSTLPGTSWTLGVQGGSAPAATNPATLVFGSDGSLSGNDGCANFTGSYTTSGTTLAISGIAVSASSQVCAPVTQATATAYRTALAAVTSWLATSADDVPLPSGVRILSPVKLILSGPTILAFSQG